MLELKRGNMKRTNQLHNGNVTGSGKTFKGTQPMAFIPIGKRKKKSEPSYVLPCGMSELLIKLFRRVGLPAPY